MSVTPKITTFFDDCDDQDEDGVTCPIMDYKIIPTSESSIAIIDKAVEAALSIDEGARERKRKAEDVTKVKHCMKMILSNLIIESFESGAEAAVRISRRNGDKRASRYRPQWFTINISNVATAILMLPSIALITLTKGMKAPDGGKGIQSILKPAARLLRLAQSLSLDDFSYSPDVETIIYKTKVKTSRNLEGKKPKGTYTEYDDTEYTHDCRKQMVAINEYLRGADISFKGKPLPLQDRQLRRYFSEEWNRGGRLFGTKWQSDSKLERRHYRINGKPCVEVDFKACNLFLAYARKGLSLPDFIDGDAYELGWKGLRFERAGLKKVMLAMLCSDKPLIRFPNNTKKALGAGKSARLNDVTIPLSDKHKAIADLFYSDTGMKLQHTESEIIVATLLELKAIGVTALPIHDCVVVAEDDQAIAREVMLKQFFEFSGQHGAVDVTPLKKHETAFL